MLAADEERVLETGRAAGGMGCAYVLSFLKFLLLLYCLFMTAVSVISVRAEIPTGTAAGRSLSRGRSPSHCPLRRNLRTAIRVHESHRDRVMIPLPAVPGIEPRQ